MNIGMFTDTYYPQINGLVTSLKMLEKEMSRRGHKLYIFTTSHPTAEKDVPNVYRMPSISFKFSPGHRVAIVYPPKLLFGMRRFRLDIIHTHSEFPLGIFGRLVSEVYRKPIVHTYHTLWEEYVHYFGNSRIVTKNNARRYSRIFCNGVDGIICPTEKTKNILESYGVKKPMVIIPTGIDFEPFRPGKYTSEEIRAAKAEIGIPDGVPVIINIGRIAREKSIDKIIEKMPDVLEKIPDAKLVIIGDGPALDELEAQAAQLNIEESVVFPGSRPWAEIGKYYQMGDIFVSTSTSETQGLTYVEAIAAGVTAVVRRDDSTNGVIMDGETGFSFDGEHDMVDVIIKALNQSADEKNIMREKAYDCISGLSAEKFAESMEEFYSETIQRHRKKKNNGQRIRKSLKLAFGSGSKNMDEKTETVIDDEAVQ